MQGETYYTRSTGMGLGDTLCDTRNLSLRQSGLPREDLIISTWNLASWQGGGASTSQNDKVSIVTPNLLLSG